MAIIEQFGCFYSNIMSQSKFFMLQANQTGNSNAMELEGAKGCFDFLLTVAGLTIPVLLSDRHRGIKVDKRISSSNSAVL